MIIRAPRPCRAVVAGAIIVLACGLGAGAATAQKNTGAPTAQKNQGPPNALQGFSQNRDEPVKIRAGSLELREKDKRATFTGDVHVLQGDTEMHCKMLVVFYEEETAGRTVKAADPGPGGDRQIRLIEAKGDVVVVQKDQNATGDAATFNMRENTVTLVGNIEKPFGLPEAFLVSLGTGGGGGTGSLAASATRCGVRCLARPTADGRSHERRVENGRGPGRRHLPSGAAKPPRSARRRG